MSDECLVNELNLSFSGDEYDSMFITQSTFRDISTQDVEDADDFFSDLGEVVVTEHSAMERQDFENAVRSNQDEMCEWIFDFKSDVDNGLSVSTQEDPIIVTRHSDGEKFEIGASKESDRNSSKFDNDGSKQVGNKQMDVDLKRFSSVVSDAELDRSKYKRSVNFHFCSLLPCLSLYFRIMFYLIVNILVV